MPEPYAAIFGLACGDAARCASTSWVWGVLFQGLQGFRFFLVVIGVLGFRGLGFSD